MRTRLSNAGRMIDRITVSFFVLFLVSIPVLSLADGAKPRMEDVASKLSCYCGTCPHLVVTACGCGTAEKIKEDVQKKIDAGMTEDEIIQEYVALYGQTVLSAPPRSGFNLTAWVLPFLAFVGGGTVLFFFLKQQSSTKKEVVPTETEEPEIAGLSAEEKEYREALKKELEARK